MTKLYVNDKITLFDVVRYPTIFIQKTHRETIWFCVQMQTLPKTKSLQKKLVFFYLYVDLEEVGGFTWCTGLHPYCTRRCSGVGAPSNCPNYTGKAKGIITSLEFPGPDTDQVTQVNQGWKKPGFLVVIGFFGFFGFFLGFFAQKRGF